MTERRLRRVGHKGADLIVQGNTRPSFDAALAAGVDMIEFDVVPEPPGIEISVRRAEAAGRAGRWRHCELILAHDWGDARSRPTHTLAEGLDHLASAAFAGIELDVDLKLPGYEIAVLQGLRERGLLERTVISSQYRDSLMLIRHEEPSVRLGWSVPLLRRDPFRNRAALPAVLLALQVARAAMPARAAAAIRAGWCDAIMSHWRFVTPRLVRAVASAGGELYAWTVDELPLIRSLHALGVTGVITNDPRLFAALTTLA